MTIDTLIMLGGAVVAVLPFLGFPHTWDNVIYFIAGVCIIALGIAVRRRGERLRVREKKTPRGFVEAAPYHQGEHEEL